MMFISLTSNTTGGTSGAGTAYHSKAPKLAPGSVRLVLLHFYLSLLCFDHHCLSDCLVLLLIDRFTVFDYFFW